MYFLKCSSCGHFNEVKTQYMVLCSNCNKKLDNNYLDWSKRHPDKSFEDYKQLVCESEINDTSTKNPKLLKQKGLKFWISFAVIFSICIVIGQLSSHKIIEYFQKPTFDKVMIQTASEINKSCPMMIDNVTRLDNTIVIPGNVFQYNYTLVTMAKDSINIFDLKNILEPTIINVVKTSPEMKTIRDHKTTIRYYYRDKSGVYLFAISVKPEQYQ